MSKIFEALQRAESQAADNGSGAIPQEPTLTKWSIGTATRAPAPSAVIAETGIEPLQRKIAAEPPAADAPAVPAETTLHPGSKVAMITEPSSLAAEQYRVLRSSLLKQAETRPLKVILVTSPGVGDGKTTTALNLALSFALKPGTRALFIEADMRRPSVANLLALPAGPGLVDYLAGEATQDEITRPACIPGFWLAPAGRAVDQPAELLHSGRLAALMEAVRKQFDWVVLDSPPMSMVADQEVLANHADGILLVVRPLHTSRELFSLAAESLDEEKSLGIVFNATQSSKRYGGYYGYRYGYGSAQKGNGKAAEPAKPGRWRSWTRSKKARNGDADGPRAANRADGIEEKR